MYNNTIDTNNKLLSENENLNLNIKNLKEEIK
jgi:hypothetical protein